MRSIKLLVGATPIRRFATWAYPAGKKLGYFVIPSYKMTVSGADGTGKPISTDYEVLRFGVHCTDGKRASVVGLSNQQTHTIKAWIPTYRVHSAVSLENGAWQVYGNFLIHDGPDTQNDVFATIGCIEVTGPSGFVKFNDQLIDLAGPPAGSRDSQLAAIGKAGVITITYVSAPRPPLQTLKVP